MKTKSKAELRDAARRRPPLRILGYEHDEENLVVTRGGEVRHDVMTIIHEDDVGAIRQGYYCANCYEAQGDPMPEKCWVCGFPMRDRQAEMIANGYRGNIRMGPSTTLENEEAFMEEWAEKNRRESRDEILRPSQILLPGRDFSF